MAEKYDIAIVGAGIAGASVAAELEGQGRIAILEAEDSPGYHTTGRSAAFWNETYGGTGVQPLTTASGAFLREGGFMTPRAALTIGRTGQEQMVDDFVSEFHAAGVAVDRLGRKELENHIPGLLPDWTCGALEPSCCDIDVAALHQHYLTKARKQGVDLLLRSRLTGSVHGPDGWSLELSDGRKLTCDLLINAAGAWADQVAEMSGVKPLGIQPLRRTMVQLEVSAQVPADLPLVLDICEQFYFKPEAGGLWLSPHDETPSEPCDAAPEEIDVALAIDRLEKVVGWQVRKVTHKWAGLRSFAPDRLPVYGIDGGNNGFFWFAGQGGFGIQTAPAAAKLAAGLIIGKRTCDLDAEPFSPKRFA